MTSDNTGEGNKSRSTVIVTGAAGLLGKAAVSSFRSAGWRVIGLTHADLDISDEAAVQDAVTSARLSLIVNCAATTDVDRCEREPDWAYATNERGPRLLARYADRVGADLVHVSTDYVFDGRKEGYYTQLDAPSPLSVYASSKLAGERAVTVETPKHYIVRSSWVFGVGGKNFGSRVVDYARAGARLKGVVDQISIPTYAPDLADRIMTLVNRGHYGLYHVTNSGPATWYDFARRVLDLTGFGAVELEPINRADLNQPAERPANSAMRCLKSEELGLEPLRPWTEALNDFVRLIG